MIYNYIQTNTVTESTKEEEIISVVWNEYCNYKQMLESCTDESARPILEAKYQVLYEVSFKDMITKILENIRDWWKKFKKFFKEKILDKIFKNDVAKNVKEIKEKVKSFMKNESTLLTESYTSVKLPKESSVQYKELLFLDQAVSTTRTLTSVFGSGNFKYSSDDEMFARDGRLKNVNDQIGKLEEYLDVCKTHCNNIAETRYESITVTDNNRMSIISKADKVADELLEDDTRIKNIIKTVDGKINDIDKIIAKVEANIKNGNFVDVPKNTEDGENSIKDLKDAFDSLSRARKVLSEGSECARKIESIIEHDSNMIKNMLMHI